MVKVINTKRDATKSKPVENNDEEQSIQNEDQMQSSHDQSEL